ncbi:glycoside hydrolase family 31 protein [Spirochaeta dissipatitropha]
MEYKQLEIIHIPHGNGQPYYQQHFERIPRMPKLGQAVICCAEVNPIDGAETMDLEWHYNEQTEVNKAACVCIGDSDSVGNSGTHRSWQGCIPPASRSGTVHYRFVARTGYETVTSSWYSYKTEPAIMVDELQSWRLLPDGSLEALLQNSDGSSSMSVFALNEWGLHASFNVVLSDNASPAGGTAGTLPWATLREERIDGVHAVIAEYQDSKLVLSKKPFSFTFMDEKTGARIEQQGSIEANSYYTPDDRRLFTFSLDITSLDHESFYGFGERYNRLNQRGQILSNRVFEQYKNQKLKTYMPVPFFFTNTGWGLLIDTDRTIDFDLAAQQKDRLRIEAETDKQISMMFLTGNPERILKAYFHFEGKPELPPDWVFGPWMSGNEWNSQARVMEVVQKTRELDIPAEVLVIEAWSDETSFYQWNDSRASQRSPEKAPKLADYQFSREGLWPDPKAMIDELHSHDIKLVLWQIPVVKFHEDSAQHPQHDCDREYVVENDLVFKEADGSAYTVRPGWFRSSFLPDFSRQETRAWWFRNRRYLLEEMGVDGFKTDGGEHLWGYEVSAPSGGFGDTKINTFPKEYLDSYTEFIRNTPPDDTQRIIFSRAGYRGAHKTPMHWSGDQDSTWDAYRGTIRAMLNANLSGISFIGWDIGGFTGPLPSPELYLRSAAAAVFSPLMQYHSEYNDHRSPLVDRTPWNIGEYWKDSNVVPEYRFLAHLRMALKPYLIQEAKWAVQEQTVLMQPLFFRWHTDKTAWQNEDSYMLGRYLLVAPILEEGQTLRKVYLPEGEWSDFWTGEKILGPCTIQASAERSRVPVYVYETGRNQHSNGADALVIPDFRLAAEVTLK